MFMCKKKKKLIANNFKRIVMTPLNVHSIFKTNISNNYHVPLKYFNVLIAITKSGFFFQNKEKKRISFNIYNRPIHT